MDNYEISTNTKFSFVSHTSDSSWANTTFQSKKLKILSAENKNEI